VPQGKQRYRRCERLPGPGRQPGFILFSRDALHKQSFQVVHKPDHWKIEFQMKHILPGKQAILDDHIYIKAVRGGEYKLKAKIFGKNLPRPVESELIVNVSSQKTNFTWEVFAKEMKDILSL